MAQSIIAYDQELPEISSRRPWEPPTSHLVKDVSIPSQWREDTSGRRPSELILVPKIRSSVDRWRIEGYPGASKVTQRLFRFWFDDDHEIAGFDVPFRYHFCQREAIETLAWLVEIVGETDSRRLIEEYATVTQSGLLSQAIQFQTSASGKRQLVSFEGETRSYKFQDLPPENLRRFAFKLATGSGKTWVMAMAIVWSQFHKLLVPDSSLSTNFLVVAPNVIVYQRLEKDFADNAIFYKLPLIPPEWRGLFSQKVILRGDPSEPALSGNLFVTNIHQLYRADANHDILANPVDTLLGPRVQRDISTNRSILDRVTSLPDLVVLNDEAHHVHDENQRWSQSLLSIANMLPNGISGWLDFSATPKDQNGFYFPWVVCDYPLAQAVEDRIVKAPIIVTQDGESQIDLHQSGQITRDNLVEKYSDLIQASVQRWKDHFDVYQKLQIKPVLFIMVEKNVYADRLGKFLVENSDFGFRDSEVLVIHTDSSGDIRKSDLESARIAARNIDTPRSKIKVIVSVMMLREGWDVRSVTVVLGLRPFTARAEILPEQVIGRGLRLIPQITPDRTQTLEVLGTPNLLGVLREQLEAEGVGLGLARKSPPLPVIIMPLKNRLIYDIGIPIPKPSLSHNFSQLLEVDVNQFDPIYDQCELDDVLSIRLRMQFATTETEVDRTTVAAQSLPLPELLSGITVMLEKYAGITGRFADVFPLVRRYVEHRCFGRIVDLDDSRIRGYLSRHNVQDAIAKYLSRRIGALTVVRTAVDFEKALFHLSETRAFCWRRDLPPLEARKTVFNFVATYNEFERSFAKFLDRCSDILRFAALGTTEQGSSGATFRVDYVKPSGAIGFYYPDWIAVQETDVGILNWIIETKGRAWEGTNEKDLAIQEWCRQVSIKTSDSWRYLRVNQTEFSWDFDTFRALSVSLIANAIFKHRATQPEVISDEWIRKAREEERL